MDQHSQKSKIKVALLYSGQPRFLNGPQYEVIKDNILNKYDCDVFCHFWWKADSDNSYVCAPCSGLGRINISKEINIADQIRELYMPKVLVHDDQLDLSTCCNKDYNILSMYTSMKKSYEIFEKYVKDKNIKYDFVLRMRYDTSVRDFPDLSKLDQNHFYFPNNLANRRSTVLLNQLFICPQKFAGQLFDLLTFYKNHDFQADESNCRENLNTKCNCLGICTNPKTDHYLLEHLKELEFRAPIFRGSYYTE